MNDLTERLDEIERQLDEGTYRQGPWASLVEAARLRDQAERRRLIEDVSRVSDKLHGRKHPDRLPLGIGLSLELLGALIGLGLVELGLRRMSSGAVLVAGLVLAVTWQPLLKVVAGYLLGVRYSYVYLLGVEPRVKMRYGTYLAASRRRRVALHLSGMLGSPLALWWVAVRATRDLPHTATVCWTLGWILVAVEVATFVIVISGARRSGPLRFAHFSSGGSAAAELRSAASP